MKRIAFVGSGKYGYATGKKLSENGFPVTWLTDSKLSHHADKHPLFTVTNDKTAAYKEASIIFVDAGDLFEEKGIVNLSEFEEILDEISAYVRHDFILVINNHAPVGTNKWAVNRLREKFGKFPIMFDVVSNPGGLAEEEIAVGTRCRQSEEILEYLYEPYKENIYHTYPEHAEALEQQLEAAY
ncbi:hypothetical protein [Pseudalkalibacillus sp. SCS-8]|uniref:hypothetical protein n=1 Tax=Pseudalkalibacillus nanhaiensis TaxID=3115291 RepID=UPI0032DACFBE